MAAEQFTTVRTVQGDTLSAVIWRHYGTSQGHLERVLDANPALADMPAVLPAGIEIRLPEKQQAATPAGISLWD